MEVCKDDDVNGWKDGEEGSSDKQHDVDMNLPTAEMMADLAPKMPDQ
jgi:hypothetical protein